MRLKGNHGHVDMIGEKNAKELNELENPAAKNVAVTFDSVFYVSLAILLLLSNVWTYLFQRRKMDLI